MEPETVVTSEAGSAPRPARLLLAESDVELRHLLSRSFRDNGFDVTVTPDGVSLVVFCTIGSTRVWPFDQRCGRHQGLSPNGRA